MKVRLKLQAWVPWLAESLGKIVYPFKSSDSGSINWGEREVIKTVTGIARTK